MTMSQTFLTSNLLVTRYIPKTAFVRQFLKMALRAGEPEFRKLEFLSLRTYPQPLAR